MNRNQQTVAGLRALKGSRQLSMLHIEDTDEAEAATSAGIDMLSIEMSIWNPEMRDAAGNCFVQVGLNYGVLATQDDYLRAAHDALLAGADCVYCAASLQTIEALANEGIPVVGHVGLVPSKRTWTGGFVAVGRTSDSAILVYRQTRALEEAGAFAAEIEVVPERVAAEISSRTSLLLLSMGAGAGCDGQYLFSNDVLGYTEGHVPRHSKRYRDFASEYDRLQNERVKAFGEFIEDIKNGEYPGAEHSLDLPDEEFASFRKALD